MTKQKSDLSRAFSEDGAIKTHVGGQALIEGVMMRGKYNWAVAVREPDGAIYVEEHDLTSGKDKNGCAAAVAEAYRALVAAGIPAEDARYLLPNACETKIVITMNVRELLHFFELRCCNRAQWEIREMAWKMLELARPTAPYIFADAGAPCIHGTCPEGKMTCGNPYPRVDRSQL